MENGGSIYLIAAIEKSDVAWKARWFRKDARGVEPSLRAPQKSHREEDWSKPRAITYDSFELNTDRNGRRNKYLLNKYLFSRSLCEYHLVRASSALSNRRCVNSWTNFVDVHYLIRLELDWYGSVVGNVERSRGMGWSEKFRALRPFRHQLQIQRIPQLSINFVGLMPRTRLLEKNLVTDCQEDLKAQESHSWKISRK